MHLNYYFLRILTGKLNTFMSGMVLDECYSQNKGEIIMTFTGRQRNLVIKSVMNGDVTLLWFPDEAKRARKNSADLFKILIGQKLQGLRQSLNERSFIMEFERHQLLFKLHGRRSNLVLFEEHQVVELFRSSLQGDKNSVLENQDRSIDQSQSNLIAHDYDLKAIYPTFGKRVLTYLKDNNFHQNNHASKIQLLDDVLQQLDSSNFFIYRENEEPYLCLLKNKEDNQLGYTTDPIQACNLLAREFNVNYTLHKERETALSSLRSKINKCNSYIRKTEAKVQEIKNRPKHEELANILMANLHVDAKGQDSIELLDFYRNQTVTIKLKKDVSLQKNAENYYRKGKNQLLELQNLEKNMVSKKALANEYALLIQQVEEAKDIRSLRRITSHAHGTTPDSKDKQTVPYFEFTLDSYRVLVGKNARSNDLLLQQYTTKNDLWLHARNVSGSHVIIKEIPGQQYPKQTIEKSAQLAAWYSKGKNDTFCPVIYTPRKFVRKPKGAAPGQVVVQQEEVILVKPCQKVQ